MVAGLFSLMEAHHHRVSRGTLIGGIVAMYLADFRSAKSFDAGHVCRATGGAGGFFFFGSAGGQLFECGDLPVAKK
jgi:hypothetical protein